jgi:autotransporter family porin
LATGANARINSAANVKSAGIGASAQNGGIITLNTTTLTTTGTYYSISSLGAGSTITATGNLIVNSKSVAIYAASNGVVNLASGTITSSGTGFDVDLRADSGGTITATGSLTLNAYGPGAAVYANGGTITLAPGSSVATTAANDPAIWLGSGGGVVNITGTTLSASNTASSALQSAPRSTVAATLSLASSTLSSPQSVAMLVSSGTTKVNLAASSISGNGTLLQETGTGTTVNITADNASTLTGATLLSAGDTAQMTLQGGSTWIMPTDSTLTGLTFDSGTLRYGGLASLSVVNPVTLSTGGATLDTNGFDESLGSVFQGTGALTKIGTGKLSLSSNNTYAGATTISSGTLALTGSGSIADSSGVTSNGTFDISGTTSGTSIASLAGSGTVALGSKALTLTDGAGVFSGRFTGSGTLIKAGPATQILSGAGSTVGGVDVTGGTLRFEQSGAFTTTGNYATQAGATSDVGLADSTLAVGGAFTQAANSNLDVVLGFPPDITAQSASLAGQITVDGFVETPTPAKASAVTNNTYTLIHSAHGIGGGFINSPLTPTGQDYLLYGEFISANGLDYDLGFRLAWTQGGATEGTGTFTMIADTALNIDIPLGNQGGSFASGWDGQSLTKNGDGLLELSAANTYTGPTIINGGTLALAGAGSIADSSGVTSSGTFDISGTTSGTSIVSLAGTGTVALGSKALTLSNGAGVFSGTFTGSGTLIKAGPATQILSGAGSTVGSVDVTGGTLRFEQSGAFTTTGNYTTQAGATSDVGLAESSLTVGGAFTQAANSNLSVTLGFPPDITAQSAGLAGQITINGFVETSTPVKASVETNNTYTLIHTAHGVAGGYVNNPLTPTGIDYLLHDGFISANGLDYDLDFRLAWTRGGATQGTGTFTLSANTAFNVDVPLSNQTGPFASGWDGQSLIKNGDGLLELSAANTYTGSTTVNGGTLQTGLANTFANSSNVVINGGTLDLNGNNQLANRLAGSAGTILLNGATLTANNATTTDSTVYAGAISDGTTAGGTFVKTGEGTLTLSGQTTYTGQTQLDGGTLVLDGSTRGAQLSSNVVGQTGTLLSLLHGATFTGMIDPANVSIDAASIWNLTANSTVDTLALAGQVNFPAPAAPAAIGRTLTMNNLVGQGGTISLYTVLGDDHSKTDQLILNGGSASGTTSLLVHNQGGTGAQTTIGIPLVAATNGATTTTDAFSLNPQSNGYRATSQTLAAGAYDYSLVRGGNGGDANSWYLTSQSSTPAQSLVRPEAGVYLANNQAARWMFMMTLRDREGYAQPDGSAGGTDGSGAWGRLVGGSQNGRAASNALSTSADTTEVQLGADLWRGSFSGQGTVYAGVMGSWGHLWTEATSRQTTVNGTSGGSAAGSVDGYAAGIYGTWYQKDRGLGGAYVDSWAQYQWSTNKVNGSGLPQERYDADGFTASVETGYGFLLRQNSATKLYLEPQLQVAYVDYSADDHTEASGTQVRYGQASGMVARVGARLYADYTLDKQSTARPYVEMNYWYNQRAGQLSMSNDLVQGGAPRSFVELKIGAIGNLGPHWLLSADVGVQSGERHYNAVAGQLYLKYAW